MPIISIVRDWGTEPSGVRISTTDTQAQVESVGYLPSQEAVISALCGGHFTFLRSDAVMVYAIDGSNIYEFTDATLTTLQSYVLDYNGNFFANNVIEGYKATVTTGGTTTLTSASAEIQNFTGTMTEIVIMPDVTTLQTGWSYLILNNSSSAVTVKSHDLSVIQAMDANTSMRLICVSITDESAGGWDSDYAIEVIGVSTITGTANQVIASAPAGNVTLSLPQDIATSSTPTFLGLTAGNLNLLGNTLSSINANGNINLIPNGTGNINFNGAINWTQVDTGNVVNAGHQYPGYVVGAFANQVAYEGSYAGYKSRSTVVNSFVAVQNNDFVCNFGSYADDGTQFLQVASMLIKVDGAVSTGVVPGRLEFYTANTSGALTLGMTLTSAQLLTLVHPLGSASGGTGVANTGTITLGGNLTTSGAFASTFTMTNTTSVTFPTSGTLATTANVAGGGLTWTTTAAGTQAMAVDSGYVVGAQCTFTLPATAAVGAIGKIKGSVSGWILTANTGQTIKAGAQTTSSGGTITSAAAGDSIQVTCIVANTTWSVDWVFSAGVTYA